MDGLAKNEKHQNRFFNRLYVVTGERLIKMEKVGVILIIAIVMLVLNILPANAGITAYQFWDNDDDCSKETKRNTYQVTTLLSSWSTCGKGMKFKATVSGSTDTVMGYLGNGGYGDNYNITGQPTGNEVTVTSKNTDATGYIKLVEVDAVNPAC